MRQGDVETRHGSAGAWIASRLGDRFGTVTFLVPKGYEAYARVFHPAADAEFKPVKWATVAEAFGKTVHSEMQWHALLGLADPAELSGSYQPSSHIGAKWIGEDPPTGEMNPDTLDALCEILTKNTPDPAHCNFGLCTIQGLVDALPAETLKPLLHLPRGRDYIVLTGPLAAVGQISRRWPRKKPELIPDEAPNLIWPSDRSWIVVSDVDLDSTLVGGSRSLIEEIVTSPKLEAWPVRETDSIAADGDRINRGAT